MFNFFKKISWINQILMTKHMFETADKDYKTLIIGSSHLLSGYKEDKNLKELNLCVPSQDFYNSYKLYEYANSKNLENIIVSFSVFSPGFCLQKSKQRTACIVYKLLFGIEYEYPSLAKEQKLYDAEKHVQKVLKRKSKNDRALRKVWDRWDCPTKIDEKEIFVRARKHLKSNERQPDEMYMCEKLFSEVKANGQKLFVVIAPVLKYYRDALPEQQKLFAKLYDLANKYNYVKIINFFDDESFSIDMFTNGDHLNEKGAQVLAEKVRKIVQQENAKTAQ